MKLKLNLRELKEFWMVTIVMIGILLPVRILFVQFISSYWLGSFGVVSLISIVILILAKKQKLGKFGEIFEKQMYKSTRGKRKWLFIPSLLFTLFMNLSIITAIDLGENQFVEQKQELKEMIPNEQQSVDSLVEQAKEIKPQNFLVGVIVIFYLIFFRFDIYSGMMSYLNDITNGFLQHFAVVFLVEQLEVMGLMLFYRFKLKKKHKINLKKS